MKHKFMLIACMASLAMMLSGCEVVDSGGGGDSYSASSGGSGVGGDDPGAPVVNPEPTSMALLGSGLAAYAFLKRKKKKK